MTEEYMRGYAEGFDKGYAAAISSAAAPAPDIRICPVCGLMEGEACYMTTPCYYGANKNR